MQELLKNISQCQVCLPHLALGVRPVMAAHEESRVLIIGQAPGIKVHNSGVPWEDKSGDNLRAWMDIADEEFYDPKKIAIIPMGFCYPGKGKSGDLPPRKECAPLWHQPLLEKMNNVSLTILIGQYAQAYYLKEAKKTLTETVRNFEQYLPTHFVLPHPSPRNNIWQAKNPWFKETVLPTLKDLIKEALRDER